MRDLKRGREMPGGFEILWIDDDSPSQPWTSEGVRITTAQSCQQGVDLLLSGKVNPSWVIVDLILPQAGWQNNYLKIPGLQLTEYISQQLRNRVVVYTIVADQERRKTAKGRGAAFVFEKTKLAFGELIKQLRDIDGAGDVRGSGLEEGLVDAKEI